MDATQEELNAAMQSAHLDDFIYSLPQGYDTVIGEEGVRLSAGQAQRIAIARAFLKNSPILILDEPTSSLDPTTESMLEESTRLLMKGRTVITIAHRLNTILHSDRIVVLEDGCIVEMGTHRELMALNGLYLHMVRAFPMEGKDIGYEVEESARLVNSEKTVIQPPSLLLVSESQHSPILWRLFGFLRDSWWLVALSVLLGSLTISASVGLMGSSAWLISMAALHPSIAELGIAIVGVRFFGISRGVFRYTERLVSHRVTFRLLSKIRVWFYEKLEPLAPARLAQYRVGDLLNRIVTDIDVLENFFVRVVSPPIVALVISLVMFFFLERNHHSLGWIYLGFVAILGIGMPILTQLISSKPGADMTNSISAMRVQTIDFIQGLADLLSFGRADDFRGSMQAASSFHGQAQRRMARVTGVSSAAGVLFSNLGMLAILASAIPLVSSGQLDGVMLAVLTLATQASFEAIQPLPLAAQALSTSVASARRLFAIADENHHRVVPKLKNSTR